MPFLRPSWVSCTLVALAACAAVGCGDDAAGSTAAGSGGSGGGAGQASVPSSLSFEKATLTMVPGEARDVTLIATPPAEYMVRFALIGEFKDASLDRGEVVTGSDGRATVRLTAPTGPTTFSLRASVGDSVSTQAGVSVSASGFATLQIEPSYSGKRPISYWLASVRAGTSCEKLVGNPPEDGDLKGSAPAGQYPQVSDVPVGPPLAVTLRAGFYLSGCKDVSGIPAGAISQLVIPVSDVPIKVDETDLGVTLTLDPPATPWSKTLGAAAQGAATALLGGESDDVAALLAAMQAATPTAADAQSFEAASTSGNWPALVTTALGGATKAPTALRTKTLSWLLMAAASLDGAMLSGQLTSAGKATGQAFFDVHTLAGADAAAAGLSTTNLSSWKGEPGDTVLLGTTLFAMPSRMLTALSLPIVLQQASATSLDDALGTALGCDTIAAALVSQGAAAGESYAGCGLACTQALCKSGLVTLWDRVRDASASAAAGNASLQISATATATVDDLARPATFDGTWVGSFVVGAQAVPVAGKASGSSPAPPQ